jgi:hypothetical protein
MLDSFKLFNAVMVLEVPTSGLKVGLAVTELSRVRSIA